MNRQEAPEPQLGAVKELGRANLGSSVVVKGDLTASEDLTVDGQVEGRIDLPDHVLTIGPNAKIRADIVAKVVTVFGSIVGAVTAREKVDLRRGASLDGNLTCAAIAMQDGAMFCGRANMEARKPKPAAAATPSPAPVLVAAE